MAGSPHKIQRIITLSSGKSRGSNLLAIYRYFAERDLPVEIAAAVFTSAKSPACASCRELGIPTRIIPAGDICAFEEKLIALAQSEDAQLIALCGFMRLLSPDCLAALKIPVLNIHPALLPKYGGRGMYGLKVHEAVFAAGESFSGATIHRVDPIYDHGEILSQKTVDIADCSCPQEIADRVLAIEHEIYAPAIFDELQRL